MRTLLAALLLLFGTSTAFPGNDGAVERVVAARDAFRAGERVKLARIADGLAGSDYAPWVRHWQLRLQLEEDDDQGVREFLEREKGFYVAEKLRGEWLRWLGRRKDWATFRQELPPLVRPDQEITCYALQARLELEQDESALAEARPLWFDLPELPDACQPLMERLIADGRLSADDVWARMRRLVEARRAGAVKALIRYLPSGEAPDARRLDSALDNPAAHLAKLPSNFAASRAGRELAILAAARLSRNDPAAAAERWRKIEQKFEGTDRAWVWGQIALQAALRHQPEALEWYALAGGIALSEEQQAWHVRAALRAGDWVRVEWAIGRMSPKLVAEPEWIYWLGRAYAAQGRSDDARAQYLKLAGQPHFYGNLADEELGRKIAPPPKALPPTAAELAEAEGHPGLRRALALLHVPQGDLRIEGVREWVWHLRGMNDRQLLAAAEFAHREGVWDRAINTADRTQVEHDYGLRFLAPYRDTVSAKARAQGLDPGWVFGLMRQESRFVMNARSSAGAQGLMQLMPATARWVARKIGLTDFRADRVTELDTNVTLGTSYLKMVLEALDGHPVLASAAYNAGPGRAKKWRADRPLEGAIYAETIPFNETRDYVKKVMSNTVYYATLFESRPQSLKERLGVIRPAAATEVAAAEELP